MNRIPAAVIFTLAFIGWIVAGIVLNINFDRDCTGHLKRAADSNTVEIARQEVQVAVSYLEKNKLTQGYTSLVYNTPDEDIGFWYQNLKASLEELNKVKPEATQQERTNVLMKLRETLMDGASVTCPAGIAKYPDNAMFCVWGLASFLLTIVFWVLYYKTE